MSIWHYMTNEEILASLQDGLSQHIKITHSEYQLLLDRFETLINEKYQLEQSLNSVKREYEND